MALLQFEFYSDCLKRRVPVNMLLPCDKLKMEEAKRPYKTIYLLHGLHDDHWGWITKSRVREWAEEYDLAVVCPYGENGFYMDSPVWPYHDYGKFIGQELVEMTRKVLPLSDRREDTFIGGLSMGGYGAIINGLKYHETFGYIVALSSALNLFECPESQFDSCDELWHPETSYGDLEAAAKTDVNQRVLVENVLAETGKNPELHFPKMYLACGSEDFLIRPNRTFVQFLTEKGVDFEYHETPGIHNWKFWDEYIEKAIKNFLPLQFNGRK